MTKKRIFMFSSVHRWNDTRIFYKQATSLAKKYHIELHIPASFKHEIINDVNVFGLPLWKKINDRRNIRKELWRRIKKSNAEIYHFHDPELLWIGIKIRLYLKKKVIFDIHEDYESAILSKNWIPKYQRLVISKLFSVFERLAVIIIKNNIHTTELISDKFNNKTLNKEIIYNYPFRPNKEPNTDCKIHNLIIYVGVITKIRGFNEIIKALFIVKKSHNFKFLIIGSVPETYEEELHRLINDFDLTSNIEFTGLMKYEEIFEFIEKAIVGLLCYLPEPNHLVTFPNKIFEYISKGTPVIASDFPLYRQVVNGSNCGRLVNPTNCDDIAGAIIFALNNPDKMKDYGINGYNAIIDRYNWKIEEVKLLKYYDKLI